LAVDRSSAPVFVLRQTLRRGFAGLFLAGAALTSAHAALTVQDDLGRSLTLARPPVRIVSLAPGATEMLFAAGAGDKVIATVAYSDDPAEARAVPRIGDAAAIDMERLIALHADVVVVWPKGGNPAQIAQVERMGLPVYREQVDAFSEFAASLRRLGTLAGTAAVAERAALELDAHLAALAKRYGGGTPVTVLLEIWDRPIYTVGGKHLMSDALKLCGARNIFGDLDVAAPVVDIEAVIARNPDMIVAAAPPGAASGWLDEWKPFGALQAVRSGRLIAFEDQRLSGLGPSALAATAGLCQLIDAQRATR
jgi:iron complex transport system substrate-binding protein